MLWYERKILVCPFLKDCGDFLFPRAPSSKVVYTWTKPVRIFYWMQFRKHTRSSIYINMVHLKYFTRYKIYITVWCLQNLSEMYFRSTLGLYSQYIGIFPIINWFNALWMKIVSKLCWTEMWHDLKMEQETLISI